MSLDNTNQSQQKVKKIKLQRENAFPRNSQGYFAGIPNAPNVLWVHIMDHWPNKDHHPTALEL